MDNHVNQKTFCVLEPFLDIETSNATDQQTCLALAHGNRFGSTGSLPWSLSKCLAGSAVR
jgi:hypothetical protein